MTSTETPTDTPVAPKISSKANRYRLFDDGEGDYRIYEISSDPNLPKGTLLPIPTVPGFQSNYLATKFIRSSGNKLEGKQFMILKGMEIGSVAVQQIANVQIKFKPKAATSGPAATTGEDGQ